VRLLNKAADIPTAFIKSAADTTDREHVLVNQQLLYENEIESSQHVRKREGKKRET
jgi:hypothetical protein